MAKYKMTVGKDGKVGVKDAPDAKADAKKPVAAKKPATLKAAPMRAPDGGGQDDLRFMMQEMMGMMADMKAMMQGGMMGGAPSAPPMGAGAGLPPMAQTGTPPPMPNTGGMPPRGMV